MTVSRFHIDVITTKALVSRPTTTRFLAGQKVRRLCALRIYLAMKELGLLHLLPADHASIAATEQPNGEPDEHHHHLSNTTNTTNTTNTDEAAHGNVPCNRIPHSGGDGTAPDEGVNR